MTLRPMEIRSKSFARIAGALYLLIAIFGAFSIGYVPSVIIDWTDAALTASNLMENLSLYKMGIFGDIVVLWLEVFLTAMLYVMLRPISATLSMIAALSRMGMVIVMAVNLLLNIMPIVVLQESPEAADTVMMFLEVHQMGVYIWQLFFAIHLLALGYMVAKSGLFPKTLGWAMFIGAFGYLIQALYWLTFTESAVISSIYIGLLVLVTIGELAFAFWLVIMGLNQKRWQALTK
ncbi:MAG: DUF4386 domain-containing protein [Rhodobacteraceae bacterium]|nr:DUF4386 domain-containing protein [Paracoccaceae bacterium]